MDKQFEDILGEVLAACEGLDDSQIDAVLKTLMEKEGFDEKEMSFVDETFSLLEASSEQYADLQAAKEDGIGREEWLTKKFGGMLQGRSEEEVEMVMNAVEQATEVSIENEIEAAEADITKPNDASGSTIPDNNIKED